LNDPTKAVVADTIPTRGAFVALDGALFVPSDASTAIDGAIRGKSDAIVVIDDALTRPNDALFALDDAFRGPIDAVVAFDDAITGPVDATRRVDDSLGGPSGATISVEDPFARTRGASIARTAGSFASTRRDEAPSDPGQPPIHSAIVTVMPSDRPSQPPETVRIPELAPPSSDPTSDAPKVGGATAGQRATLPGPDAVPRALLEPDELAWLPLDEHSIRLAALIDGIRTIRELAALRGIPVGMAQMRIAQLRDRHAISFE